MAYILTEEDVNTFEYIHPILQHQHFRKPCTSGVVLLHQAVRLSCREQGLDVGRGLGRWEDVM